MLEHNQYEIKPGPYQHYKGGIYIVENILTHHKVEGVWTKIQDPLIIYRNLEAQYEAINGDKPVMVIKTYCRTFVEFHEVIDGVPRFKPL